MKKQRLWIGATALAVALGATAGAARADRGNGHGGNGGGGTPINVANVGFATPESVLFDEDADVYLVSNINGGGLAHDNNGFISRLSPNGTVLSLKWIAGGVNGVTLDAPKGSAITRGTLYIADIDHVRMFDARTGAPKGAIAIAGATFLNDVAADEKGNVFVSDIGFKPNAAGTDIEPSGTDAIHRIDRNGNVSVVAAGNALLHHPNGVAVQHDGGLQVASFDPFDATKEIYQIDRQGQRRNTVAMPAGNLDGVVLLKGNRVLVSSWETGSLYSVKNGVATVVASSLPQPADIGLDTERNRVLVPLFGEDRVVILPLAGD